METFSFFIRVILALASLVGFVFRLVSLLLTLGTLSFGGVLFITLSPRIALLLHGFCS